MALRAWLSRICVGGGVLMGLLVEPGHALAAAGDPLRAVVVNCEPWQVPDVSGGWGNSSTSRFLRLRFALFLTEPGDSWASAELATKRIEVCYLNASGAQTCPGTKGWVIFDKADPDADTKTKTLKKEWVGTKLANAPIIYETLYIDISTNPDWMGSGNQHFTLRINSSGTGVSNALDNGFCANWKQAATNPTDDKFRVYSLNPAAKPAGFLNVCNAGSKVYWQGGGPVPVGVNPCLPDSNAEWLRKVLVEQDRAHQLRVQASLLPSERQNSRYNGVVAGVPQAFRVFAGPHMGATGNAGPGAFYMEVDSLRWVQPAQSPAAIPANALSVLPLATHEFFHELQAAWVRSKPAAKGVIESYLNESITASTEVNLCLVDFPNESLLPLTDLRRDCVSAGKLGVASGGPYREKHFLEPGLNVLAQPYESALFFRYVAEQFAYPTGSAAHPSDTASTITRPANAAVLPPRDRPSSDEGIDILGLILRDQATLKGNATSILNKSLVASLGRPLDRVVLDLHTAMVLKDYNDTDAEVPASGGRWRFEWTHNQGYFSNSVLPTAKPFAVPFNDLNGFTVNPTTQVGDGLRRARRIHDSWFIAPSGVPLRDFLAPGASIVGPQPVGIGAYGAAYFSVSVDPVAWAAAGKSKVAFQASASLNVPFLRAFRISEPSPGRLVPSPICQLGDDNTCPPVTLSDGSIFFNVPVPLTQTTREVLIVASGGPGPSQLSWSFGTVTPTLSLIEPTASTPALIGFGAAPRKFAVKLSYRDQNNKPFPMWVLQGADLTLRARDPNSGATCDLTGFTKWPVADGALMVVTSVPAPCYPAAPSGTLDLEAEIQGHVAFQLDALKYSDVPQFDAAVIAVDKSGSMNLPVEKFQAAKSAAKALVSSFIGPGVPTTWAGVVAFDDGAHTIKDLTPVTQGEKASFYSAIQGISAGGQTSIGDALYESQSILAKAFDHDDAWKLFDRQTIVLLSDGMNSAAAQPVDYYGAALGGVPTKDDDGPWFALSPLHRPTRLGHKLPTPVISGIAIGQDADLTELDHLAHLTGGTVLYAPAAPLFSALVVDQADAQFHAYAVGAGYDRVQSARVPPGGSPIQVSVEPGVVELRVNLVSGEENAALAVLTSPNGATVAPTDVAPQGQSTSFRVFGPDPGTWTVQSVPGGDPAVTSTFVESVVRSPVQLFATFGPQDRLPLSEGGTPDPDELDAWVGSDLFLRAAVFEETAVRACTVRATLQRPDGSSAELVLRDDGTHGDESTNDGVFGVRYAQTAQPGLYTAKLRARCTLGSGFEVSREKLLGVTLNRLPDLDADGLPDRWQARHAVSDPSADTDADGLSNALELEHGTDPNLSDTDGGGEADGSEVAAGRDPREAVDDGTDAPELIPVPGNGVVYLPSAMTTDGHVLVVERGASLNGPFDRIPPDSRSGNWYAVDGTVLNDETYCYRMRAELGAIRSGWSAPACTRPRLDPVPPTVQVSVAPRLTHTRDVTVEVRLTDPASLSDGIVVPVDLGAFTSGVEAMRVWFDPDSRDAVQWRPPAEQLQLRLPDQPFTVIRIQSRDYAGNLSEPVSVWIARPLASALDRAIASEERAEDAIEASDLDGARSHVLASLPEISAALAASVKRLAEPGCDKEVETSILTRLAKIHGLKVAAIALLKPQTIHLARVTLETALKLELEVAGLADEKEIRP